MALKILRGRPNVDPGNRRVGIGAASEQDRMQFPTASCPLVALQTRSNRGVHNETMTEALSGEAR